MIYRPIGVRLKHTLTVQFRAIMFLVVAGPCFEQGRLSAS